MQSFCIIQKTQLSYQLTEISETIREACKLLRLSERFEFGILDR